LNCGVDAIFRRDGQKEDDTPCRNRHPAGIKALQARKRTFFTRLTLLKRGPCVFLYDSFDGEDLRT